MRPVKHDGDGFSVSVCHIDGTICVDRLSESEGIEDAYDVFGIFWALGLRVSSIEEGHGLQAQEVLKTGYSKTTPDLRSRRHSVIWNNEVIVSFDVYVELQATFGKLVLAEASIWNNILEISKICEIRKSDHEVAVVTVWELKVSVFDFHHMRRNSQSSDVDQSFRKPLLNFCCRTP